jgi:hypothetical protein
MTRELKSCFPTAEDNKRGIQRGQHLVRSKIEIDGLMLEQVKKNNCLGCELNLDGEQTFEKKTDSKEYATISENI